VINAASAAMQPVNTESKTGGIPMLVGLLNFIFNALIFLLNVAFWVMLVYVLMTLLIPTHKYTALVGKYVEPVLSPIRAFLVKRFPKLGALRVDLTPVVFWLLIKIAVWILMLLQAILL
jgi:hypothetical protein